ncbi:MarR family winged helix-turn-helix transcriptional regulator [Mesorhizobium sp. 2RAF21]|uniref:MarR family winged helix-turn-helix transcriptional regulator n=1 Tax=Mesorhizobium sp. 2RAF21 TaxID=3232995 RepID=UPI003F96030E
MMVRRHLQGRLHFAPQYALAPPIGELGSLPTVRACTESAHGRNRPARCLSATRRWAKTSTLVDISPMRVYTRIMARCYSSLLRSATRRLGSVYDRALAPLGINIAQYALLRTIEHRQPVSLTELARSAELERSTVGRNVRVLERLGFVAMERGENDHREAAVTLCIRGVEILQKVEPIWEECQKKIEARLGPVKVTALEEILRSF